MNRDGASDNYRKPPVEHQFKKGKSGNPNGRPPKKEAVQPGLSALGGGLENRLMRMVLEEGTRPITVKEGDKAFECRRRRPCFERCSGPQRRETLSKATRPLFELMDRAESGRASHALARVEDAIKYKEKYGPIFEKHEREGLPPPDIFSPTPTI
jgi:hypothetical protein